MPVPKSGHVLQGTMKREFRKKSNIVLIGMPGAGKSTVGVYLAKQVAKDFLDTDISIQRREKRTLQEIIDREGYLRLRRIEEEVLLSLDLRDHVIATGGSAAYSERAMAHLKEKGTVVFLNVSLRVLRSRIADYDTRGIARREDQTFEDLFRERFALYARYADLAIDCRESTQEQVTQRIKEELKL